MSELQQIINNIIYTFRKFKLASHLNLAGLCIAFTAFFLFFSKVEENVKYNTCFKDWDCIYRVELKGTIFNEDTTQIANLPYTFRDMIVTVPHVKKICSLPAYKSEVSFTTTADGKKKTVSCPYIDSDGRRLSLFGIRLIKQKKHPDGEDIYVPKSFAIDKYGKTDVIGDTLSWDIDGMTEKRCIAGVYEDFPSNCCVMNAIYVYGDNGDMDPANFNYLTYIKLDSSANKEKVEAKLLRQWNRYTHDKAIITNPGKHSAIELKLTNIHLTYFSNVDEEFDKGSWSLTATLFFSALLVIILTNVNAMNFTLAMAPTRVKSINAHRVLGAGRKSIIVRLMSESFIICIVAYLTSMVLLIGTNCLTDGNISPLCHIRISVYTLIVAIAIAVVSSLYPAYYATSFPLSMALKGTFELTKVSKRLRTFRIGFQIIISSIALTCTLVMLLEDYYVFTTDYGYNKNQVLYGTMNSVAAQYRKQEIRNAVMKVKGVESVSYSRFSLGTQDKYMEWLRQTPDKKHSVLITVMPVDRNYLRTMGIRITEGHDFCKNDTNGAFIINEAAARKYPWARPGKYLLPYDHSEELDYKVIGICQNIIFSSVRKNNDTTPLAFIIPKETKQHRDFLQGNVINIRLAKDADVDKAEQDIKKVYHKVVPEEKEPLSLCPLNRSLADLYHEELVFFMQSCSLAAVYISITLIGVFCLSLFESEYKRKEIGIRKVFGASTEEILLMFNKKYLFMTTLCFLISAPISWYLCERLLSGYSILSPYLWVVFPISYFIMLSMVLGTVTIQSWKNAKELPINSVRTE